MAKSNFSAIVASSFALKSGATVPTGTQHADIADATAPAALTGAAPAAYSALTNLTNPVTKTEGEALSSALASLRASVALDQADITALRTNLAALDTKLNVILDALDDFLITA